MKFLFFQGIQKRIDNEKIFQQQKQSLLLKIDFNKALVFVYHEQLFYSADTGFGFVSDDNLVFCPEKTLTAVIAHIHYFPDAWKGQAHTTKV